MAKVLLVAHWDWVLWNFRLPLARALKDRGHEVILVFPFGEYAERLRATGFRCVHWSVKRESLNPLREIAAIVHLAHIYRREKPDLVTHFTIKPNLYGSIAAAFCRNLKVINTFTGLGFLFFFRPHESQDSLPFCAPYFEAGGSGYGQLDSYIEQTRCKDLTATQTRFTESFPHHH